MKTRMYLIVVIFVTLASFVCAEELSVFSNEEIAGTWVNPNYTGFSYNRQKLILYQWGYYEVCIKINSDSPDYRGTYQLIDKWTDSDGDTLYKSIVRHEGGGVTYELGKISKDKTTWEYVFSYVSMPTLDDLNPDNANYRTYYRQ
jgi:hypothetical protein